MCFGCSKEPSHRDGFFEYPQLMFWLRIRKIIISYALLSGGLATVLQLSSGMHVPYQTFDHTSISILCDDNVSSDDTVLVRRLV